MTRRQFVLVIEVEGNALTDHLDYPDDEEIGNLIARTGHSFSSAYSTGERYHVLHDTNGNECGHWRLSE